MLELKNISYKVVENGKDKIILDNFSCTFNANCLTAITGQNGSGKSTLTKLIMGIVRPSSGQIIFNGKDITNLPIDERAKLGLNYAFQQPVLFKGITVKELLDISVGEVTSIPSACEMLSKVGICAKEYLNRDFDKTLSGGEQKRIELALALAKNGDVLLFDEPEAGIDMWSFDRLSDVFKDKKTYIVVSHQEKLLKLADRVIVLKDGKIFKDGKPCEIINSLGGLSCKQIQGRK